MQITRRKAVTSTLSASALMIVGAKASASQVSLDYPSDLVAAIRKFTGGANWKEHKVTLDVAELVDNGNTVPIGVSVASPMNANDHVTSIAIFNEKNPFREVALFTLSQDCGKAEVPPPSADTTARLQCTGGVSR